MTRDSLDQFTASMREDWAPVSTGLIANCRQRLSDLMRADETEGWLGSLTAERPASRELYRDPGNGFMLLAHTENEGLYRPPHDHGRAWVVYGVQSGELEIRTYGNIPTPEGEARLVLRDATVLKAGDTRAYLPGDIHDTRCLTECALLFRFTERDLRREDQVERKVARFAERDGHWTLPGPCA